MVVFWIILGIIAFILALVLIISYICYRLAFFVDRKHQTKGFVMPVGKIYEEHSDVMKNWAEEVKQMPYEKVSITSFDGLKLCGKYYEYAPHAPIELMFHGYRGSAERDLCGGVQRCFKLGHSALLVDQRGIGDSDGKVITFGVNEHKDCLKWIDFMIERFGKDVKIIICGISMGASTVLMAAGEELPENVIGVLADCGFNSAKDIIKSVIKSMGLPENLAYPFVKLGARLYGGFNLEETCAEEALKKCKIPAIFFHGDTDDFVPCNMSKKNFDSCNSKKRLVTIKGAGHGLSYVIDPDTYLKELREFFP
ncbi:MAG: alpha/beta hydrolase [Clostridia bacterium]|nr:alpha/beta hydrolase [Clostridia bacterium]